MGRHRDRPRDEHLDRELMFNLRLSGLEYNQIADKVGCVTSYAHTCVWKHYKGLPTLAQQEYKPYFNHIEGRGRHKKQVGTSQPKEYKELVFDFGQY